MTNLRHKSEFLAVYDYGMGGLWFVISARNTAEIKLKYPFLEPTTKRPDWISATEYKNIKTENFQDIDEQDISLLAKIRLEVLQT